MRLHFLGANRQVTGSCTLLQAAGLNILIDRGMFQESRFDSRNRDDLPIPAKDVDHVILTHAHLDHCGLLPRLVKQGYRGPIHTHHASAELAELVMYDSARLQQEDEDDPADEHRGPTPTDVNHTEPLYDEDDVAATMKLMQPVGYEVPVQLTEHAGFMLHEAGHILGSASIQLALHDDDGTPRKLVFSGDLGQDDRPIINDPAALTGGDVVVLESTYGNRDHPPAADNLAELERFITETHRDGGKLLIPSFAIERAQELLYHLNTLKNEKRIGTLHVFLDSPMAAKATDIFDHYPQVLDEEAVEVLKHDPDLFDFPGLYVTRTRNQSMAINAHRDSAIIIAGSGMCTGGRIVHHLKRYLDQPENRVLFVGYQANGTLGREIQHHAPRQGYVNVDGRRVDIRCKVDTLHGMSGHADRTGLVKWLTRFTHAPRHVFLNHGEADAAEALRDTLRDGLDNTTIEVPKYREAVDL